MSRNRFRKLQKLTELYFRMMEWTVHWAANRKLRKPQRAFILERMDLCALEIDNLKDFGDPAPEEKDNLVQFIVCVDPQTGKLVVLHRVSFGSEGRIEWLPITGSGQINFGKPLPPSSRINSIRFKESPHTLPFKLVDYALHDAFTDVKQEIRDAGIQWNSRPNYKYLRDGVELLDRIEAKNLDAIEVLEELRESHRGYVAHIETAREDAAKRRHETQTAAASTENVASPADTDGAGEVKTTNEPKKRPDGKREISFDKLAITIDYAGDERPSATLWYVGTETKGEFRHVKELGVFVTQSAPARFKILGDALPAPEEEQVFHASTYTASRLRDDIKACAKKGGFHISGNLIEYESEEFYRLKIPVISNPEWNTEIPTEPTISLDYQKDAGEDQDGNTLIIPERRDEE